MKYLPIAILLVGKIEGGPKAAPETLITANDRIP